MQSRSYLFLGLVIALTAISGFLYTQRPYQLGLDVQGGVRFTYQIDTATLTPDERSTLPTIRENLQRIMQSRAQGTIGVAEPNVQLKGEDQLIIELPGYTDEAFARSVLGTTASLEWYHARNVVTEQATYRPYTIAQEARESSKPEVHFVRSTDAKTIKPGDPEYRRIVQGWSMILKGTDLEKAEAQPVPGGSYIPTFRFSSEGAEKMRAWTLANRYKRENLATVLDGVVISIAPLAQGAVITDRGEITGQFNKDYVISLVNLLNSGALPVSLTELQSERVDPTIGKTALDKILTASAASAVVIALFLLVYYVFPGLVALLALVLYTLFTLTVLKWAGATFSLAAIAGFVLSLAMAVDANILVFERVKEELRSGKALMQAIELGFKRALPAIVDSNACTILTALVLANIGTGPVKGFASTLIIGVLISLFTAITVTRSLLVFMVGSGIGNNVKLYGLSRQWFGEGLEAGAKDKTLRVVQNWKRYFILSALPIVPGLVFLSMGGLKANVEFQGGFEGVYAVGANETVIPSQITSKLEEQGYRGANAKLAQSASGRLAVVTVPKTAIQVEEGDNPRRALARTIGLSAVPDRGSRDEGTNFVGTYVAGESLTGTEITARLTTANVSGTTVKIEPSVTERIVYVTVPPNEELAKNPTEARAKIAVAAGLAPEPDRGLTQVGPSVQKETIRNAILGVLYSVGLIVVYLGFRFGVAVGSFGLGLRFAASTIGAILHDVFMIFALVAITGYFLNWEVSALFISAILTIIGFSTHDTIVIFDRIRENLRRPHSGEDYAALFNRSVTQSFARSINTSFIMMVSLVILIAIGSATPDLMLFNATMLVGLISGTYSSIFNATPILYLIERWVERRWGFGATLMGVTASQSPRLRAAPIGATADVEARPTATGYGQVKRRASAVDKAHQNLDDDA